MVVRSRGIDDTARRLRRLVAACGSALWIGALFGACSDDGPAGDEDPPDRRCGDGLCDSKTCETPLRCATDCGTCSGDACTPTLTADPGTCDKPCFDSCGCLQANEVCTADFDGSAEGTCVPLGCRLCAAGEQCVYTVDADGKCSAATCEAG